MGSSPRMRGTPHDVDHGAPELGIIPAYAGNTITLSAMHEAYWDHPRVCGEHATGASTQVNCTGSSPRMRGTLQPHAGKVGKRGIIPAYAGNTSRASSVSDFHGDHPRVCGEHQFRGYVFTGSVGSSPRMRGTLESVVDNGTIGGIIPAYAGNTTLLVCPCADGGDHPRICGEHEVVTNYSDAAKGSSPHMRGTRQS